MRLLQYFFVLFLVAFASTANAQTNVTVNGTISPPGCNASFSGGGSLDWGTIPWSSLSSTVMTTLPGKAVTFQVQCPTGTLVSMAFWVVDPNKASAMTGPNTTSPNSTANHGDANRIFGIGMDPVTGQKLGNFSMISTGAAFDGTAATTFGYTPSGTHTGTSFGQVTIGWAMNTTEDWTVWNSTTSKPASATLHTFTFNVEPQLNIKTNITATQEVPFSGVAQFNVRYF
jgi:hypothetical protein